MDFRLTKFLLLISIFLLITPVFAAGGQVFSKYHSIVNITGEEVIITKHLALKNNGDVGILPGQVEFRIGKGTRDSITNANLNKIKVIDSFGQNITYTIRETPDYTSLVLNIYHPLLPGFQYQFDLQYEINFEASGIFFKSLQVPLKETSIPIENGVFEVHLPKNNYFTYLGELDEFAVVDGGYGEWSLGNNLPNSVEFEYSFIPLRVSWMRGSYLFWILVNVIIFIFLVYEIRKEVIRVREEEDSLEE